MNWIDKLNELKKDLEIYEDLDVFFRCSETGAEHYKIEQLVKKFPLLKGDFEKYLEITNGVQFDMFLIAGANDSITFEIEYLVNIWKKTIDTDDYLPIGKDPSGDLFLTNKNGEIYIFDQENHVFKMIAENLNQLFNDFFMGKGYHDLFGGNEEKTEWVVYLKSKNWI